MRAVALILALSGAASAGSADFSGYISSWRQDCSNGCALPAAQASEAAAFKIDVPMNPGEARVAKFARSFGFASGEKIEASFTVYYLCPRDGHASPAGESCPSRYLQIQAVLKGDARAFCSVSLNPADAQPFPVMMCAGENLGRAGERLGVSLSRKDVAPPL